jgi:hypothetical protein
MEEVTDWCTIARSGEAPALNQAYATVIKDITLVEKE